LRQSLSAGDESEKKVILNKVGRVIQKALFSNRPRYAPPHVVSSKNARNVISGFKVSEKPQGLLFDTKSKQDSSSQEDNYLLDFRVGVVKY
jgi:hypothetical protein